MSSRSQCLALSRAAPTKAVPGMGYRVPRANQQQRS